MTSLLPLSPLIGKAVNDARYIRNDTLSINKNNFAAFFLVQYKDFIQMKTFSMQNLAQHCFF